jgi:hypothetical protein
MIMLCVGLNAQPLARVGSLLPAAPAPGSGNHDDSIALNIQPK